MSDAWDRSCAKHAGRPHLAMTGRSLFPLAAWVLHALLLAQPAWCNPSSARVQDVHSLIVQGRYSQAERAARLGLDALMAASGTDSLQVAALLDQLTEALRRGGRGGRPEAREGCERALRIKADRLGKEHPEYAASLYQQGFLDYVNGDLNHARSRLELALTIRERALGKDHPDVAESLVPLAGLLSDRGDNAQAQSLITRALTIRSREFGASSPEVGECLSALATIQYRSGDFAEAASTYERALPVLEASLGPGHSRVGTCLNNLGALLYELGDYESSLAYFERALTIRRKALGRSHELVGFTLANMGRDLAASGRLVDAGTRFQEALSIQESRFGRGSPEVGRTLSNMGQLDLQAGQPAKAREVLSRAVSNLEHQDGGDPPELADALSGLAMAEAAEGHVSAAREMYERAIRIRQTALGPRHPDVGLLLTQYARVLSASGDEKEAVETALRGEEISREHLRLTSRGLSERQALQYAGARPAGARVALLALVNQGPPSGDEVDQVWDAVIRGRTLVLDEIASRNRGVAGDSTSKAIFDRLGVERRRLANLLVAGPSGSSPARYRDQLDQAREAVERDERALASRSALFRLERDRERIGLSEVSASLPEGSALVAYAAVGDSAGRSYAAFVLRPPARPVLVPLVRATVVDALISGWLEDIAQESGADKSRTPTSWNSGTAVRHAIWDPLAPSIEGAKRVFVVPEGAIHLVNLAALPASRSEYLIESGTVFHYLSAERDIVVDMSSPESGTGLLALGDPTYGGRSRRTAGVASASTGRGVGPPAFDCFDFDTVRFTPLPATGQEVADITSLWGAGGEAVSLVGSKATESAFKARAPGHDVLHIATHGFFLGMCPEASTGTRGIGATTPLSEAKRSRKPDPRHPLLLAGLALAGANRRASVGPDAEDGILTAEEIAGMDLSGVRWAVLSACDTGNGRVVAGEGILGLQRAFQIAGARTVIMSLWAVDDKATRSWMRALYEGRLLHKLDTAAAVNAASLEMLRERRAQARSTSPFYWAGFVASGDWQ